MSDRRIVLGSRSPRRRSLLEEAGWIVEVRVPEIDDGDLAPQNASAFQWITALAWLKARAVRDVVLAEGGELTEWPIVAGDTVCEHEGELLGQPVDGPAATAMIRGLRSAAHRVWTGLCVLQPGEPRRIGAAHAVVTLGDLPDAAIDQYVDSGAWKGKAGGYNLSDRIEAGWPIEYTGDASTIMGMPLPLLDRLMKDVRS